MNSSVSTNVPDSGLPLRAGLWLAQVLLAGVYLPSGIAALFLPGAQASVAISWAADVPQGVLTFLGAVNLAAGLGVLLPALTRIAPQLTVLAAIGSAALQAFAILFQIVFGETTVTLVMNVSIIVLSIFVAWGRLNKAEITPRWQDQRMSAIDVFAGNVVNEPPGSVK